MILRALASLASVKNLSKVNAKETLVHDFVQELAALAVSSDLTVPQTDDSMTLQSTGGLQGRPFYLRYGQLVPTVGAFQDNGTVWDSMHDLQGATLDSNTTYRVDILGFKQGCTATPLVQVAVPGGATWTLQYILSQWDAANGVQYFNLIPVMVTVLVNECRFLIQ